MEPVLTLEESGYHGCPYLHRDSRTNPVVLVWWAKTPTGRQSRFLHWVGIARTRIHPDVMKKDAHGHLCNVAVPTAHCSRTAGEIVQHAKTAFPPPKLARGYEWQGPFFRLESDRSSVAPDEGQQGPIIVMHRSPKKSENEGIPLGYVVDANCCIRLQQI